MNNGLTGQELKAFKEMLIKANGSQIQLIKRTVLDEELKRGVGYD